MKYISLWNSSVIIFLLVVITEGRWKRQDISFGEESSSSLSDCQTPDGLIGSCIDLTQCPILFNQLTSNPSPVFYQYLRQSICGYQRTMPLICCPAEPKTESPPFSLQTTPPPTRPIPNGNGFLDPELCGNSNHSGSSRIVGGREANKGDWPWIAALGYENGQKNINFLCGGALISQRHVLTAAHCVYRRPELAIVSLGNHDLRNNDEAEHQDVRIERTIIHDNYNSITFENDIAILRLATPVEYKSNIRPICLPLEDKIKNTDFVGFRPFVAGWGTIAYHNASSPVLREVQVPIVRSNFCKESYQIFRAVMIDERTLCAGEGGKDACQGDSGGPLMQYWDGKFYIIGVVSLGYRCAEPNFPGIYTRVTRFEDWIISNVN